MKNNKSQFKQGHGMPCPYGFTLIELLTVLALLSILFTLAIPPGYHLIAQNRTTSQINILTNGLSYARNEAISRSEKLIFCKSVDQKKCGGKWSDGQIITDTAGNLLRVFSPISKKNNLVWNSSAGIDDAITFLPTGYTNGQRGTFFYCGNSSNSADSRSIVLWDTGRIYVSSMRPDDYRIYCSS